MTDPVVRLTDVQKNYGALRPLRIRALEVAPGERVAVSGFDAGATEVVVNLVTGAVLPDQGTVATFGRTTSDVTDADVWLASLDRFGIVSPRAVLLEGSTLRQNLALPFTLNIDDMPADVLSKVDALARECALAPGDLDKRIAELPPHVRVRAQLARAVALGPQLLVIEHPTAEVAEAERVPLGRDIAAVAEGRRAAALVLTQDLEFAEAAAHRSLAVQPATGALSAWKRKRGWFR